jgi:hypothetical protein
MSTTLGFVFSPASTALFHEFGLKHLDVLNDFRTFTFATEEEANAFHMGVTDSVDCESCILNDVGADSLTSSVCLGNDDCESGEATESSWDSVEQRVAYEDGINAGEGWFSHVLVEKAQMDNFRQAVSAMTEVNLAHCPENLIKYIKSYAELEFDTLA